MEGNRSGVIRQFGIWVLLLVLAVGMVAILSYLVGLGGQARQPGAVTEVALATATVSLPLTPAQPYTGVDPAVVDYLGLDFHGSWSSQGNLMVDGLPPLGVYLPRTGEIGTGAEVPAALPTPFPYPTSLPLAIPYAEQMIVPTAVPVAGNQSNTTSGNTTNVIPPTPVPYVPSDGTVCAPAGLPVGGVLTQRFHRYHGGIDLGVPLETAVLATHSGQVTFAGWTDVGYGYLVTVQNGPYTTYYAHNTSVNVTQGQIVSKNSIVSWSGSTGFSSGPHVHYETRINNVPVNPLTFESRGLGTC